MSSIKAVRQPDRRSSRGLLLRASGNMSMAPLLAIPALLQELGADPSSVLSQAGIDPGSFSDAANRLAIDDVGRLVDECVAATRCPHFGLLLGIRSGAGSAGLASELGRHAETVQAGLRLLIAHLHLHDQSGVVALTPRSTSEVEFSYVILQPHTAGTAQILDASIAIACCIMRRMCGPQWRPSAVTLARARPQQVAAYRAFFRAPVRFDAPRSALIFAASILDQPNAGADPHERTRLSRLAAELDTAKPESVTERTIRALGRMVIAMPPTGDKVAEVLGMKRRRLRERLEAEGSSVKGLLEVVRCELARQLLEQSRMPIAEIAATLHYSQPGAFSRAFKGWTGKTPRQWRKTSAQT